MYELQCRGLRGEGGLPESLADLVAGFAAEIRRLRPHGPYQLFGYSFGAPNAHAVATALQNAGAEVPLLVLVDPPVKPPRALTPTRRAACTAPSPGRNAWTTSSAPGPICEPELILAAAESVRRAAVPPGHCE
jgi:thioesterase domain-containing protein